MCTSFKASAQPIKLLDLQILDCCLIENHTTALFLIDTSLQNYTALKVFKGGLYKALILSTISCFIIYSLIPTGRIKFDPTFLFYFLFTTFSLSHVCLRSDRFSLCHVLIRILCWLDRGLLCVEYLTK